MKYPMLTIPIYICLALLVSGCVGTTSSKFAYNDKYIPGIPINDAKCYDGSVLLPLDIESAYAVARKMVAEFDTEITYESGTTIRAIRNLRFKDGAGRSGGEELRVNLQKIDGKNTFITVTTRTGIAGGATQGPQSCKFIEKMIKMAASM
jgi:hypothetical protein